MYDPQNVRKLKVLGSHAPAAWEAFKAFDAAVFAEGALSVKFKELIAVAVAQSTQCVYCIDIHNKKARKAGATDAEVAEAIFVAAALKAGGAVVHGTHCFDERSPAANAS